MAQLHRRIRRFSHPRLRRWLVLLVVAVLGAPAGAIAQDAGTATRSAALARLPAVPTLERPKPEAAELEELDALLARFRSDDENVRRTAMREILELRPVLVAAMDVRMNEIASSADRDEMRRLLEDIRKRARSAVLERMRLEGKRGKLITPDYLEMVVEHAKPKAKAWQDLVSVLALSRMLTQIGSVEAVRKLIDIYVRFGEFLRVDTQLQLEKLGDKAVAALIEARRHKAEKIGRWAERQLDALGKAIPSEAVQTPDHQVLADVLRAYGRSRDPDAARIVISFANSERAQVREAARQAVAMMGEVSAWQLRDSYETIVGKRPPRDWSWERTARELFGELDRLRLARVHRLFDEGRAAQAAGKLEQMREAYDKLLAQSPMFERREEMAAGYLAYADQLGDERRADALDALRRAERLAPDEALKQRARSRRSTLEGEELLARGVADQVLFRRALELDPENQRAREALARIERGELEKKSAFGRYAAAASIGLIALLAIAAIGLRRGRRRAKSEPEPEPAKDTE
jgi:tetratricopeptide (TPR) repeat protein